MEFIVTKDQIKFLGGSILDQLYWEYKKDRVEKFGDRRPTATHILIHPTTLHFIYHQFPFNYIDMQGPIKKWYGINLIESYNFPEDKITFLKD